MLLWLLVAELTFAPLVVVKDVAMFGARVGLEKLPEQVRDKIPEICG